MLVGQEGPATAVPLSRESRGFDSMALRPGAGSGTYRVSVAYDVAVQRHVETKVTLHSGIQVIQRQPCISRPLTMTHTSCLGRPLMAPGEVCTHMTL